MTAPHDLHAEQAVLGAAMFDSRVVDRVGLRAEHFYDPTHGALWNELIDRHARGEPCDAMALRDFAKEVFHEIGGVRYVIELEQPGSGASINARWYAEGYADIIRNLAGKRAAAKALSDASDKLKDGELFDVLAEIETRLRAIGGDGRASADMTDAAAALRESMTRKHISTGFPSLDRRIGGLFPGDLIILAGRPSMGKTTMATQLSRNVARRGGVVHFASLDMAREQVAARAIAAASLASQFSTEHIEYFHLRPGSAVDSALVEQLAARLPRSILVDDTAAQTLAHLEASARATARRMKHLDLIVVDYLQLMSATRSDGRVHEVSEISAGLKAIAKRLACPVVALSQLSRAVEGRDNKRPTLSDLRDSGSIEQDADIVMGVYREAYYLERHEPAEERTDDWIKWRGDLDRVRSDIEIITLKQRQGPIGTDRLVANLAFDTVKDRNE